MPLGFQFRHPFFTFLAHVFALNQELYDFRLVLCMRHAKCAQRIYFFGLPLFLTIMLLVRAKVYD